MAKVAMRILFRIDHPAEMQMALRALKSQEADTQWMMMCADLVLVKKDAARSIVRLLEGPQATEPAQRAEERLAVTSA